MWLRAILALYTTGPPLRRDRGCSPTPELETPNGATPSPLAPIASTIVAEHFLLNHGTGPEIGDLRLAVAEPVQDLVGVLAEIGGRAQLLRLGGAHHVDRLADRL